MENIQSQLQTKNNELENVKNKLEEEKNEEKAKSQQSKREFLDLQAGMIIAFRI